MTRGWSALRAFLLAALVGPGGAVTAFAQHTLGELLDAKAVKLSKQEVLATITGATLSGPRQAGGTTEIEYKADGTYSGSYQGAAGARGAARGGGFFGKWTVADDGKACNEGSGGSGKAIANCHYYFRSGDKLYAVVESESDRSAVALERSVKR